MQAHASQDILTSRYIGSVDPLHPSFPICITPLDSTSGKSASTDFAFIITNEITGNS